MTGSVFEQAETVMQEAIPAVHDLLNCQLC